MAAAEKKPELPISVRYMIRRDIPEVLQIEQLSFEKPWCEEDFLHALRQRNCIGIIAEQGEKVVGFCVYEVHKNNLHLLNFAVHPDFRRMGVGRQMLLKESASSSQGGIFQKLSTQRRAHLTLELRESNMAAQRFFKKMGFKAEKVLRKFYEDTGEDAFLMRYNYPEYAQAQELDTTNRLSQYFEEHPDHLEQPEFDSFDKSGGLDQLDPGEKDPTILPIPQYVSPPSSRKFSELAQLIQNSRHRLSELTGREWRVMKPDESGTLKQLNKVPENLGLEEFTKLIFETCESVVNPSMAYDGLRNIFFNTTERLPDDMQLRNKKAQRIRIPAKHLKEEYLSNGKPGQLRESFSPLRLDDKGQAREI